MLSLLFAVVGAALTTTNDSSDRIIGAVLLSAAVTKFINSVEE